MDKLFSIPDECKLSTSGQTREMDSKTINEFGIDGFTLMEMAASAAASHIKKVQGTGKTGLYICGKGNNAGDALAVARYLANASGHHTFIYFVFGDDDLSPDANHNLKLLQKLKNQGTNIEFVDELENLPEQYFDYIVDGMFGTGLNSDLRPPLPDIVKTINSMSAPVYSMDVPSGLHADTGRIMKTCIRADVTYTFGANKVGCHLNNAEKYTGELIFNNLPFPSAYRNWDALLINAELSESLPEITRQARHKYDGGVIHIMAGSEGLTGAAIMAAKSAWKQGAGAVLLYAPKSLMPVYESTLPNIIKVGVGDKADSFFREEHADPIVQSLKNKKGVLLAGPGIGRKQQTGDCLVKILREHDGFAILDADALSFWNELEKLPESKKEKWLLTPHIGEASRYLKGNFNDDFERFEWAKGYSNKTGSSLLIKGNPTILSFVEGQNYITGYDTSSFSRAGFGDVLSGAIAAGTAISGNMELAAVTSLYNGYKKSQQHQYEDDHPFGPEHLL